MSRIESNIFQHLKNQRTPSGNGTTRKNGGGAHRTVNHEFTPFFSHGANPRGGRIDRGSHTPSKPPNIPPGRSSPSAMSIDVTGSEQQESMEDDLSNVRDNLLNSSMSGPILGGDKLKRSNGFDPSGLTLKEQEKIVDEMKKENFGLKLRISTLEQRLCDSPADMQAVIKENADAVAKQAEYRAEILRLRRDLQKKENDLDEFHKKLSQESSGLGPNEKEQLNRLNKDNEQKENDLFDARGEIARLQDELEECKRKADEQIEAATSRQVEILHQRVLSLEKEKGILQTQVAEKGLIDQELNRRKQEISKLKEAIDQDKAKLQDETRSAKEREESLQAQLQFLQGKIDNKSESENTGLAEKDKFISILQEDLELYKERASNEERKSKEHEKRLEQTIKSQEQARKSLEDKVSSLTNELSETRKDLEREKISTYSSSKSCTRAEEEIIEMRSQLERAQEELAQYEKTTLAAQASERAQLEIVRSLESALGEAASERDKFKAMSDSLRRTLDTQTSEAKYINETKTREISELTSAKKQLEESLARINSAKSTDDSIKEALTAERKRVESLTQEVEGVKIAHEIRLKEMKEELKQLTKDKHNLEERIKESDEARHILEEQFQDRSDDLEESERQRSEILAELDQAKKDIVNLKDEVYRKEAKVAELRRVSQVDETIEQISRRRECELEEELNKSQLQVDRLKVEIKELTLNIEQGKLERQRLSSQCEQQLMDIRDLRRQVSQLTIQKERKSVLEGLNSVRIEESMADLFNRNNGSSPSLEALKKEIGDREAQIHTLEQQTRQAEQEIAKLEDKQERLIKVNEENIEKKKKYIEGITKLQQRLDHITSKKDRLQNELTREQKKNELLVQRVSRLENISNEEIKETKMELRGSKMMVRYLDLKCKHHSRYRWDLQFIKQYLMLEIENYQSTHTVMRRMLGIYNPTNNHVDEQLDKATTTAPRPRSKLRAAIFMCIATIRMSKRAKEQAQSRRLRAILAPKVQQVVSQRKM